VDGGVCGHGRQPAGGVQRASPAAQQGTLMIDIAELPAMAPFGAERTNALIATTLLDFGHPSIAALVQARGWQQLSEHERIAAAYAYVRDEVAFGYNKNDDLKASEVLAD
ncbi:putative Copper-transporting ATPase 2, partial [Daphnia magna]